MGDIAFHDRLKGVALDALALGVIVTDATGRLAYANAAADRIFADRIGALRLRAGKVVTARGAAQAEFLALIARAADPARSGTEGDYLLVAPSGDTASLAIRVLPMGGQTGAPRADGRGDGRPDANVILLVRIIETDCNLEIEARRLFGLTPTEAKFASALAGGLSLDEAARAHAVTLATARSHMKRIFRKTGACRQSQVVALLRGAQIPVDAPFVRGAGRRETAAPHRLMPACDQAI